MEDPELHSEVQNGRERFALRYVQKWTFCSEFPLLIAAIITLKNPQTQKLYFTSNT